MAAEPIWPGSSSFASGQTPYGFYDSDTEFSGSSANSVDRFAEWAAKRLGYPIVAVELTSGSFYANFEEAVTEYSAQVNQFNITDNLLSLKGQSTGSNLSQKNITPTMGRTIRLAEEYGTAAGVGGLTSFKTGSIQITSGSQVYDFDKLFTDVSESGAIQIKRIYHSQTPAIRRFFDPYASTGMGTHNLLDGFGFGTYSPAVTYTLMPIYEDILRVQAIELNDQIRKSAYSFEIRNNQLRIFPIPTESGSLFIEYVKTDDRDNPLRTRYSGSNDVVSDYSNAQYDFMVYSHINDVGKQWIRKYTLALSKELLGIIRSKYGNIPIPNAEVSMDGETLRAEATAEKEQLIEQLRENLEQTSRKALLEAQKDESDFQQDTLRKVPYPIYIG